jgi:Flp pilus assembly protein TadG
MKGLKEMTGHRRGADLSGEQGFALLYMAIVLVVLLLFTGLAVDSGRAYVVQAQLSKAVDGAALGAARLLNSGNPKQEAINIFKTNFPPGYMGVSSVTDPTAAANFFTLTTTAATGLNVITVQASAVLPMTFMQLANFQQVSVGAVGQATRRMVDLSLVIDVSSSIGSQWPAVRDAARTFISDFDAANDRLSLITFSDGATVLDPMPATRGFNKAQVMADVPNNLPGGSTLMTEGVYRGWDELRSVPNGQQSSLRVIVLFTDGASNGVPGLFATAPGGVATALRSYDFPKNLPDPDNQTWNSPNIVGLFDTQSGNQTPAYTITVPWASTTTLPQIPWLPVASWETHHRSPGIPTSFPLQTSALTVNGAAQSSVRGLRSVNPATGLYPAQVWNINNAARNLVEIISDAARSDASGDYPIRVYAIGMSYLVQYMLGTIPEMPQDILKRVANDISSPDFNAAELQGQYYYAPTDADVGPAFQSIQAQIIRLTK